MPLKRQVSSETRIGSAKVSWSIDEDNALRALIDVHSAWRIVASGLVGRTGKQCRARWHNHLDPSINRGPWREEEDTLIRTLVALDGTRWADIARTLAERGFARTDMSIKNRYNTFISRLPVAANEGAAGDADAEMLPSALPTVAPKVARAEVGESGGAGAWSGAWSGAGAGAGARGKGAGRGGPVLGLRKYSSGGYEDEEDDGENIDDHIFLEHSPNADIKAIATLRTFSGRSVETVDCVGSVGGVEVGPGLMLVSPMAASASAALATSSIVNVPIHHSLPIPTGGLGGGGITHELHSSAGGNSGNGGAGDGTGANFTPTHALFLRGLWWVVTPRGLVSSNGITCPQPFIQATTPGGSQSFPPAPVP